MASTAPIAVSASVPATRTRAFSVQPPILTALDAGVALPNVTDGFAGSAPDLRGLP